MPANGRWDLIRRLKVKHEGGTDTLSHSDIEHQHAKRKNPEKLISSHCEFTSLV